MNANPHDVRETGALRYPSDARGLVIVLALLAYLFLAPLAGYWAGRADNRLDCPITRGDSLNESGITVLPPLPHPRGPIR